MIDDVFFFRFYVTSSVIFFIGTFQKQGGAAAKRNPHRFRWGFFVNSPK